MDLAVRRRRHGLSNAHGLVSVSCSDQLARSFPIVQRLQHVACLCTAHAVVYDGGCVRSYDGPWFEQQPVVSIADY